MSKARELSTIGISNTNTVKINHTDVTDDEYARFTAQGLESMSTAEVLADLDQNLANFTGTHTLPSVAGSSGQFLKLSDNSGQMVWDDIVVPTLGIANTNTVKIDSTTVAASDYAKFTSSGLEGRDASEVKTDLSLNNVENTALSTWAGTSNVVTVGALSSGSINWSGTINTGSGDITTTGTVTGGVVNASTTLQIGGTDATTMFATSTQGSTADSAIQPSTSPTLTNLTLAGSAGAGYLRGPATLTIDPSPYEDIAGTVIIKGGLQVDGTTTTINSTVKSIADLDMVLASGASTSANADGAGIIVGDFSSNPTILYADSTTSWDFNKNIITTGTVTASGGNSTNWNSAYTTSTTAILDADFSTNGLMSRTGAGAYSIVTDNSSNWDTAHGWGNHSSQGYLTASSSATLTNKGGNISQWTNDSNYISTSTYVPISSPTFTGTVTVQTTTPEIIIQDTDVGSAYASVGEIIWRGEDAGGATQDYARITGNIGSSATDGSEEGRMYFGRAVSNGTMTNVMWLQEQNLGLGDEQTITWYDHKGTTYECTIDWATPSAARTITFPDATGTVLLSDGDGSNLTGIDALPSQTSHSGKYLTTDGSSASWGTIDLSSYAPLSGATFTGDVTIESAIPLIYFKDSDGTANNLGATYFDADTMYIYTRNGSSHGKIILTSYNGTDQADRLTIDASGNATFSGQVIATNKIQGATVSVDTNGGFYLKQDSSKSTIRSESQPIVMQTWESGAWQDRFSLANSAPLTINTGTATGGSNTANVAEFQKYGMSAGSTITAYEDNNGYSGGFLTNIDLNSGGGVAIQDTTSTNGNALGGLMYFQDTRTTNNNHVLSSWDGSTYKYNLQVGASNPHVGINTSSPDANNFGAGHGILTVASETGSAKTAMLNLVGDGNDASGTRVASLFYNDASAVGAGATLAGIEAYRASNHATDPGADLVFATNSSGGAYIEKMRIAATGGVLFGHDGSSSFMGKLTQYGGTRSIVGSNYCGLGFNNTANEIYPIQMSNGYAVNNQVELGNASYRFSKVYGINGHFSSNLQIGTSGSEEGQIEINSTRLLLRSTGDASGLRFDGASYIPFKNGSQNNGDVDLGHGSAQYKDLFLAGTATVGGLSGKILDTTSGSNYLKLTSTNEFNFYNSSDVSQTLHINYAGGNVDIGQSAMVVSHGGAIEFNNEIIADNYLRLRTIDDQASQWYIYNDTTDNLTFNYGNAGGGEFVLEPDGDLDIGGALFFTTDNMLLTTSQSYPSSSGRNPWIRTNNTGDHGLLLTDSANNNPIQIYTDTSSNYGFLNADWGSWDIKKQLNGNLYLNNNTTYYLEPSSTSNFNYIITGECKSAYMATYSGGSTGSAGQVLTSNGSGSHWYWSTPSSGGYSANFTGYASAFSVGTSSTGSSGEIRATNNITAYYSDERLKDFHGKIENAVDKVKQLNGYYFSENEKAKEFGYEKQDKKQIGVSAQEVEKVLPEIVSQAPFDIAEDGSSKSGENYKTVDYEKLVPLLIEAIKEQQTQIDELKEKQYYDY